MSTSRGDYVGFWWRFLAALIDSLLISIILLPMLNFIIGDPLGTSTTGMIAQLIFPALAVIIFWQAKSSTPGKMVLGAEIVDASSGEKPSIKQWIIRYLGYYVSTIPLMLGLFWVGFDKRKQGWHDKLANTVVVFKNSPDSTD